MFEIFNFVISSQKVPQTNATYIYRNWKIACYRSFFREVACLISANHFVNQTFQGSNIKFAECQDPFSSRGVDSKRYTGHSHTFPATPFVSRSSNSGAEIPLRRLTTGISAGWQTRVLKRIKRPPVLTEACNNAPCSFFSVFPIHQC